MQEFSVATTALPEILAVVAKGESVRLVEEGREVAVIIPPYTAPHEDRVVETVDRSPGWWMRLREKYNIDEIGFTHDEIESWRDRSPGPEPPTFE